MEPVKLADILPHPGIKHGAHLEQFSMVLDECVNILDITESQRPWAVVPSQPFDHVDRLIVEKGTEGLLLFHLSGEVRLHVFMEGEWKACTRGVVGPETYFETSDLHQHLRQHWFLQRGALPTPRKKERLAGFVFVCGMRIFFADALNGEETTFLLQLGEQTFRR
jgi:hypothetical protein